MEPTQKNQSPKIRANVLSKLMYCWMLPFVKHAHKNGVEMKDMYDISEKYKSGYLGDLLEKNWKNEISNANRTKRVPNLMRVIANTFGLSYMKIGLLSIAEFIILRCFQSIIVGQYVQLFGEGASKVQNGWIFGSGIFIISFLICLMYAHYNDLCEVEGMKIKVACCSLIYRKIQKLSLTSLSQIGSGQIINLISNDLQRIETAAVNLHIIYVAPIQIIILTYILYATTGLSCVPALVFLFVQSFPIQGYLSKIQGQIRSQVAVLTGRRLAVINDIISGIQVIKMYAWEAPFEAFAQTARRVELNAISKGSYIKAATVAIMVFSERFSLFLIIISHVLLGHKLTSTMVFSLSILLNNFQLSLCYYFPKALESVAEIKVSLKRLQEFLLLDEKADLPVSSKVIISKDTGSINVVGASAGWLPNSLTLTDISLNIKQGTLCCVVGKVGSGKTSLLQLMLKELPASCGNVDIVGKISYASQNPWLYVANVRNNIIFGQKFLQNKYQEVVRVCALYRDFRQFPHRDQTMVGERGVSLSGGQRARINLARAVYQDADIYLLDDPLSAVDTHVAKHLFDECIKKYLQKKTRVLVTHQLQFMKQADLIVVLEKGQISKVMTNDEVCESNLNLMSSEEENPEETRPISNLTRTLSVMSHSSTVTAYEEEIDDDEALSKDVSLSSYSKYFLSGTNVCLFILTLFIYIGSQAFVNSSDIWIQYWTNYEERRQSNNTTNNIFSVSDIYLLPENFNNTNSTFARPVNISTSYYETHEKTENASSKSSFYFYGYTCIVLCCVLLCFMRSIVLCKVCLNSSKALYKKMLSSIMQAPLRFFETNPSGRILNRFSKDLGEVDDILPTALNWLFQTWLVLLGIVIVICINVPWIFALFLVLVAALYFIISIFIQSFLKMLMMEAKTRSPIFSYISATLDGLPVIRSADAEIMTKNYFDSLQDVHSCTKYTMIVYNKMFGFYSEILCTIFLMIVVLQYLVFRNENTTGSNVGLAISQSCIIGTIVQYGIRQIMEVISSMNSVERMLQYSNIQKEGVEESAIRDNLMKGWPHSGKITFTNVSLSYVPTDPPVIKSLNLYIRAGEKVGIVGRTGAGKSSLIACLFRLTPIDGAIAIDDIDTATVDLKTLRSKISIIPQEPVLFSASLRYNIDPLNRASDETLWKALESVKLKDAVDSLDQHVSNGGSNFSAGQRQLICLARAIIRNNKILVMDEATANVDTNTDELIQQTIRENFGSCTVLTIAHRLNTIMDSDRVLVMNSGEAVEFAHPHELLQKSDSYFSQMVKETGGAAEESLRKIAKGDFEKKFFDVY